MVELCFVPRREVWFVSAFVNATELDPHARAGELAAALMAELRAVTAARLGALAWDPGLQAACVAMLASVTIAGSWCTFVDGFPFHDENTGLAYNKLGHFEFAVEYFAEAPALRRTIAPVLVQQGPLIAAEWLRRAGTLKVDGAAARRQAQSSRDAGERGGAAGGAGVDAGERAAAPTGAGGVDGGVLGGVAGLRRRAVRAAGRGQPVESAVGAAPAAQNWGFCTSRRTTCGDSSTRTCGRMCCCRRRSCGRCTCDVLGERVAGRAADAAGAGRLLRPGGDRAEAPRSAGRSAGRCR